MCPTKIKELIQGLNIKELSDFHVSGDKVFSVENKYILKISDNAKRLEKEYQKDKWVNKYIPSPKPILFTIENNKGYYLREYLVGENLCADKYLSNPELLINLLVEAMEILHKTKVIEDKYIIDNEYKTLIHGDFCLPNILVKDDKVVRFIDLGDSGIGDPWRDYAWCIWSLEYNLKSTNYTPLLLKKLNITFDKEKYKKYINL